MSVFITRGANVLTRRVAIFEKASRRCSISPAMRCEKNLIGSLRTCQKYVEFPTAANLPLIRNEYNALIHADIICTTVRMISAHMKNPTSWELFPGSSSSIKNLEKPAATSAHIDVTDVVIATKATADPAPSIRFFANSNILFRLPEG